MPPNNGERRERLAVNLYDLDRLDPETKRKFFAGRLDTKHVDMRFDRAKDGDEAAVLLTCDLLTAATICDMLRSRDREMDDSPTRLYLKREAWSRLPSYVVLTIVKDGKVKLNPKVFPTEVNPADIVPLPRKKVVL